MSHAGIFGPAGALLRRVAVYSTAGTYEYGVPDGVGRIFIELWGAGGGSAQPAVGDGGAGGDTTVAGVRAVTLRAGGGGGGQEDPAVGGAGGVASGGDINLAGQPGGAAITAVPASIGGSAPRGGLGALPNSPSRDGTAPGGGGNAAVTSDAGGGGGGAYCAKWIQVSPGDRFTLTVGAAGARAHASVGNGGAGAVHITELPA